MPTFTTAYGRGQDEGRWTVHGPVDVPYDDLEACPTVADKIALVMGRSWDQDRWRYESDGYSFTSITMKEGTNYFSVLRNDRVDWHMKIVGDMAISGPW